MDAERDLASSESETRARALVTGLDERERSLTVAAYFERFAWSPYPLDPSSVTAAEFFEAW